MIRGVAAAAPCLVFGLKGMKDGVQLRPATMSDARFLFECRNDPLTRTQSRSTRRVSWKSHLTWLQSTLSNPKRRLWIASDGDTLVGTVRQDHDDDKCELSWTVSPGSRRHGYGKQMVRIIASAEQKALHAEIKPDNEPSKRIAEYCGLHCFRTSPHMTYWRADPLEQRENSGP